MSKLYVGLVTLALFAIISNAYKITREAVPVPAIKNAALEYKGPVFLIKETTDAKEPFIGLIVDGGIEMVRPNPKHSPVPYANLPIPPTNESTPEIQEDPEYFAVLVTPETVAQAQISRSTTINIPVTLLLSGVAAHIPWLMVLRKRNHFDYFNTLMINPKPIPLPPRRRYKRNIHLKRARLLSGDKNYEMLFTEDEKMKAHEMCSTIVQELVFLNEMMRRTNNYAKTADKSDSIGSKINKNQSQVEKGTPEEYVLGTEYIPTHSKHP